MADEYKYIHNSDESKTPFRAGFYTPHIEIYNILEFLRSFWMAYLKSFVKKDKHQIFSETNQIRVYTGHKSVSENFGIEDCNLQLVNNELLIELRGSLALPELDYNSLCILPCNLNETVLEPFLIRDRALIEDFERQRVSTALLPQEKLGILSKLYLLLKRWSLVMKWVVVCGWINLPNSLRYW